MPIVVIPAEQLDGFGKLGTGHVQLMFQLGNPA